MSYTKGPWRSEGEVWASVVRTRPDGSEYPDSAIVAVVMDSSKLSEEEKEANSYLISAAPELLEALREACIQHHSANGTKPPMNWLLAIAKAEGRTE